MLLSEFDYDLPKGLIAQRPLAERDKSRMMILIRKTGAIIHSHFKDLPDYLNPGDVLVLNNSKVYPARAWGKKEGKEIEFLFLREMEKGNWEVLCRPAKKIKLNDMIFFSQRLEGKVVEVEPEGKRVIRFASGDVLHELKKIGFAPLPPYVRRKKTHLNLRSMDLERYQTVFAKKEGSIAAPTAGLHFTPQLLRKIKEKGINMTQISLDVGLATFQPVRAKQIENHKMLKETYSISKQAARTVNEAKENSKPVIAVGTTSVRTLESAFKNGKVHPGRCATSLFIYPEFQFRVVDKILTNFHLPKSTLLMLVAAFADTGFIKRAYQEAIKHKYRFYSYGDCMFII